MITKTLALAWVISIPVVAAGVRSHETRAAPAAGEPKLVQRKEQNYVAIRTRVTMAGMPTVMPQLMPEVHAYLKAADVEPSGPEFIRFLLIDMAKELEIEVGLPVDKALPGNDRVKPGVFPAGRYAVLTHTGHYKDLVAANAALQEWAKKKGIQWEMTMTPRGSLWGGRMEFYLTDPDKEPNPDRWKAEVWYLTMDAAKR
jgi:effector-binding domain-containing protein